MSYSDEQVGEDHLRPPEEVVGAAKECEGSGRVAGSDSQAIVKVTSRELR